MRTALPTGLTLTLSFALTIHASALGINSFRAQHAAPTSPILPRQLLHLPAVKQVDAFHQREHLAVQCRPL